MEGRGGVRAVENWSRCFEMICAIFSTFFLKQKPPQEIPVWMAGWRVVLGSLLSHKVYHHEPFFFFFVPVGHMPNI